jgi:hypothetical protein
LAAFAWLAHAIAAETEAGFQNLFDGRTLAGWETPDLSYWRVEEGAITARISKDHPCTTNQYLVWRGGELADFELKLKSRVNGDGGINNGFQFRSRVLPDHDMCGYQVDNNLKTDWLVRLYDEFGRHTLAMPGERAVFDASGKRAATKIDGWNPIAGFRLEDWHEYDLTCIGRKITLRVNGQSFAEVEDNDPRRRELQGLLGLQLHSGPPTVAQFKDIRLKIIKPAAVRRDSVSRSARKRTAIFGDALAWWPLDAGGHGIKPPLRVIPQFYKFEMNVAADGPGARLDAKVAVLDGAYFDAGTELHAPRDQITVYLRARDPRGDWQAALISKRGGHDRVHFNLFGVDLPETPGVDIGFEVCTTNDFFTTSFPIARIDEKAWHDLVGRYDGKSVAIFCDGKLMSKKAARGALVKNAEPLLIGAETDNGKIVRHFHGELEEAAIWAYALSDSEIAALTRLGR